MVLLSVTLFIAIFFITLRQLRIRNYEPKYIPTQKLKAWYKKWNPGSRRYDRIPLQRSSNGQDQNNGHDTSYHGASAADVDRNTSIRSVMTLPSYSATPTATEQVVGREGERAGMDVVVEFPETQDEEEARREEQMESLYQIRLARRQEQEHRDERRRQRREARQRGDVARLEELREERQQERDRARTRDQEQTQQDNPNANANANPNGSSSNLSVLLAEHQSRGRDQRVSSVSYLDVGRVRHDGTRVRGGSQDSSDSRPLLDAAGSMAAGGDAEHSLLGRHQRGASGSSSLASHSTDGGSEHDGSNPPSIAITHDNHETEADIGESSISPPPPQPPQYEQLEWGDAPPYQEPGSSEPPQNHGNNDGHDDDNNNNNNNNNNRSSNDSEQTERFPELPPLADVPSIAIEVATPAPSTPITPVDPGPPRS